MKKKDNTLTKVEFQVMSILWDINHSACAWDIIERWATPVPPDVREKATPTAVYI